MGVCVMAGGCWRARTRDRPTGSLRSRIWVIEVPRLGPHRIAQGIREGLARYGRGFGAPRSRRRSGRCDDDVAGDARRCLDFV